MTMRTSRLARLAFARAGGNVVSVRSAGLPRASVLDKSRLRAAGSTSIRRLASVANEPIHTQLAQPNDSQPILPGPDPLVDIPVQIAAVDELLRSGIGGSNVWAHRLQSVKDDLKDAQRQRRIGVVGDAISGARDIVSSLLQDPISDTAASRQALLSRHTDTNRDHLSIGYDRTIQSAAQQLRLPLGWLEQTDSELIEISVNDTESAFSAALAADHIVLVVDPIRLLETDIATSLKQLFTSDRPVTIVVNGPLPHAMSFESIREKISTQIGDDRLIEILFADSSLSLQAFTALSEGLQRTDASPSGRSKAFEVFQHQYLKSNIGRLQSALSNSKSPDFRTRTATSTLSVAVEYAKSTLSLDRQALNDGWQTVRDLRRTSRQAITHAKNISVINRGIEGGRIEGGVDEELRRARHDIQQMFDGKLSWLGLVGRLRVDDVSSIMAAYVSQEFGRELERQIVYETGQLSQLRRNLDTETDTTIRKMAATSSRPLSSPLLVNHLATLSLSIPDLSPNTLLSPLQQRRRQMIDIPVNRLQASARRALLSTFALAATGVFSSWWAFVPPVATISSSTAGALGLLSVVSAAALGQRRWSLAQHTFWKDWDRATGMLQGDLQEDFVAALDTRVVAKTDAAADGLDRLLSMREERLDRLEKEVERQVIALRRTTQSGASAGTLV